VIKHIIGMYRTRVGASSAADELVAEGFSRSQISVLMSDKTHGEHFMIEERTQAARGGAAGALAGGAIGALAAGVASAASLVIPGLGLIVVGPLVAAFTGAGAGATAGGLLGALVGLGIPDHHARLVEDEVRTGGILVGVGATDRDWAERAHRVFARTGALNYAND
jgi:hypothetical protein